MDEKIYFEECMNISSEDLLIVKGNEDENFILQNVSLIYLLKC